MRDEKAKRHKNKKLHYNPDGVILDERKLSIEDSPPRYFNREISWLEFNMRVLEEAMDESNPLLERVKFLSIFRSNQDEFFMIRVSGLKEQVESGTLEPSEDGLTPHEQLEIIRKQVIEQTTASNNFFRDALKPQLSQHGIHLYDYEQLTEHQKARLCEYFEREVYPVLTPLAFDPGHPFPHISNLSLNLAVVIRGPNEGEHFARVKIPGLLPRFVPVEMAPEEIPVDGETPSSRQRGFVWLEQLIGANLHLLFPGVQVIKSYPFRVIRDADLEIREDEAGDLLQTIEASLNRRRFGEVVYLSVNKNMPEHIRTLLMTNMEIEAEDVYPSEGPLGLSDLIQLYELDLPRLKDPSFRPRTPGPLRSSNNIFKVLRSQDVLLHHPYDSFAPVIDFIQAAASDPEVLAIKQTIYRVGSNSPIVEALARAAINGKQVSVLVELKARFDEENNIEWARALEKAGAHVVYGKIELKTHCKVALVVRKEPDGIRRYVHLGTGNYNAKTANIYTDIGLLTSRPDLGADATVLFNSLTGYSLQADYRKLLVSPGGIRKGIMEKIEREIRHAQEGRGGHLVFKINALVDFESVDALYRASQAGVKVDLIVRGSCCLIPGVPGMSENIRVISIVGRFLEHSRIYYFRNGGDDNEEVYLGSADLMQRNLDRRVETLFPIEDQHLRRYLTRSVLPIYLNDNVKARLLLPDGSYKRLAPAPGEKPHDAQHYLLENATENEFHIFQPGEPLEVEA
ncbi:MAG TPA: polyphosphate kinase 1 [Chloroflexia bacterium]|nr:polyphosphate kinase 1 [Chloroflexia bacterium]